MATSPAKAIAGRTMGPAMSVPMPRLTNRPVPMIEPSPNITALGRPMTRWSFGSGQSTDILLHRTSACDEVRCQ